MHKLAIAQKECEESIYWIELLFQTEYLSSTEYENINNDALEILKMICSTIIITTKTKTHNL
ncbi:four helix bundle protein [Epilithonimonas hungarica]|uniref:four helix bundle protein n=1 Tax=Epilithonimonas hungarica TaxID=454006 RepID=UPI0027D82B3E|nr:four helix bundle protein [Epilithonimonas hungarica]